MEWSILFQVIQVTCNTKISGHLLWFGFPDSSVGKGSTCNAGDPGSIPVLGRSTGEGTGTHSSIGGLPCGSVGKRICLQCRKPGFDPWVGKIPWRRERLPTPVFWPGGFHGLYRLWRCKGSDTTERFSLHFTLISTLYALSHLISASIL